MVGSEKLNLYYRFYLSVSICIVCGKCTELNNVGYCPLELLPELLNLEYGCKISVGHLGTPFTNGLLLGSSQKYD